MNDGQHPVALTTLKRCLRSSFNDPSALAAAAAAAAGRRLQKLAELQTQKRTNSAASFGATLWLDLSGSWDHVAEDAESSLIYEAG